MNFPVKVRSACFLSQAFSIGRIQDHHAFFAWAQKIGCYGKKVSLLNVNALKDVVMSSVFLYRVNGHIIRIRGKNAFLLIRFKLFLRQFF